MADVDSLHVHPLRAKVWQTEQHVVIAPTQQKQCAVKANARSYAIKGDTADAAARRGGPTWMNRAGPILRMRMLIYRFVLSAAVSCQHGGKKTNRQLTT